MLSCQLLSEHLAQQEISSLRFNFPYIEQGRKSPDSPKKAQRAIVDVVNHTLQSHPDVPLYVGGKSYGGRMASHCAAQGTIPEVKGLVFYGFPLHAPGRDSVERAAHLEQVGIPMLFLQGTNDKLANISLIEQVCQGLGHKVSLEKYEQADHSFRVPKKVGIDQNAMIRMLTERTSEWIDQTLA